MHGDDPTGEAMPMDTLARRLEYLFDSIRPTPDEIGDTGEPNRRYTNKEIADKINAAARERPDGVTISAAYIGELRRGVATDPRTSHVQALAKAFGVHPGFFVDDDAARRVQQQIELLNELRRINVRQVALRQVLHDSGLSPASTLIVEQMVARLQEVEGRAAGVEET
jgi:transcriptional regulator with XRE-family HTH domain